MDIHNKYWKTLSLLSLCVFLSSCGGGGGGGGSSSGNNTNNITPPSQNITMDFKQSDTIIGVIDSSFAYLDEFKDPSGKYRIFIDNSFPTDPEKAEANSYTHGELVSLLIGGNTIGVTNGVKIYAIPSFLAYSDQIKVQGSMYQKMYQAGVRIFSQSFGSPTNDLTFEKYPASSSLVNFYVTRSATDSLFIFAAGNNGKSNPAAEALFPKLYPRAEKGWISVVGIDPKTRLIDAESNRAGDAKNWTIAANYVVTVDKITGAAVYTTTAYGTSFAAPVIAGAAGAIQLKYPWMSRDLIKQSLLTTATDLGDPGVDAVYGWGLLNLEKAMKGPAVFDTRLTFDEQGYRTNNVIIDMEGYPTSVSDIENYTFSNDISGNAGVIKKGTGTLWFTGYNTYSGQTTIQNGVLTVTNHLNSDVLIENTGTLRATGLISPVGTAERVVTINGNIRNTSSSSEGLSVSMGGLKINGNYTGDNSSSVSIDITSALEITGTFDNGNGKINVTYGSKNIPSSATYTTKDIIIAGAIQNTTVNDIDTSTLSSYFDLKNITVTGQKIHLDYKRNSTEYVVKALGIKSASAMNTAMNLENSFNNLGNDNPLLRAASGILATPNALLPRTIDSLSAEIYASSQNLIFKQMKEMNRDLSNRMVLISNDENKNMAGIWFNGIGAKGKLYQSGYAEADTKLYGGQVGIDKYFTEKLLLGAVVSASKAEADFDKYAGKAENTNVMLSGYGLYEFNKKGLYTLGRAGIGYTESDIERDIWINNDRLHLKTDHNSVTYSFYGELGYKFSVNEKIKINPFAGLMYDHVRRGSFKEDSSSIYGIEADRKNYEQFSGVAGIRGEAKLNKVKIYGGVTQVVSLSEDKLDFKARYVGDTSGNEYNITGIKLSKNTTWINLGAEVKISEQTSINASYDISVERSKISDNMISIGYKFRF